MCFLFFFFNDTATTEIYTLSLHDALPISLVGIWKLHSSDLQIAKVRDAGLHHFQDRKSTRLNSSHSQISYAVFCLKKKKKTQSINSLRHQVPQSAQPLLTYRDTRASCDAA